jgi:hypothetical protein
LSESTGRRGKSLRASDGETGLDKELVPDEGIEPQTFGLQNRCLSQTSQEISGQSIENSCRYLSYLFRLTHIVWDTG